MAKNKCKCKKHKVKCNPCSGKIYSQGEIEEDELKSYMKAVKKGATLYRQYGVPPGGGCIPGQPGCPK